MLGTLAGIGIPIYANYLEKAKNAKATADISAMSTDLRLYVLSSGELPDSLAQVGRGNFLDPWHNPYEYLKIDCNPFGGAGTGSGGKGKPKPPKCEAPAGARRDRFLKPLNSDYDLYSKGTNGVSKPKLNGSDSRDDILRANSGAYIGLASEF